MNKNNLFLTLLLCISSALYAAVEKDVSYAEEDTAVGEDNVSLLYSGATEEKIEELEKKQNRLPPVQQKLKDDKNKDVKELEEDEKLWVKEQIEKIIILKNTLQDSKITINELYRFFESKHLDISQHVNKKDMDLIKLIQHMDIKQDVNKEDTDSSLDDHLRTREWKVEDPNQQDAMDFIRNSSLDDLLTKEWTMDPNQQDAMDFIRFYTQ